MRPNDLIYIFCEMITIRLVNISVPSYSYNFFMGRIIRSNFNFFSYKILGKVYGKRYETMANKAHDIVIS